MFGVYSKQFFFVFNVAKKVARIAEKNNIIPIFFR